jgi:hypothetical protein
MPPRWSRKPDRADPDYRKLDDRMNFAVHVASFAAVNSGLWFFRVLRTTAEGIPGGLAQTPTITTVWTALLVAHAVFIFAIAQYPPLALYPVAEAETESSRESDEQSIEG